MQPVIKDINIDDNPVGTNQHKAVVDTDANRILSIVSNKYKIVKHSDLLNVCDNSLNLGQTEVVYTEYDNLGARMVRLYRFPKLFYNGIQFALLLTNSYDLSLGIHLSVRGYRERCMNDLFTGSSIYNLSSKHTEGFSFEDFSECVKGLSLTNFEEQIDTWEEWKHEEIDNTDQLLKQLFVTKKRLSIARQKLTQYTGIMTKWILFMLVTNVLTHEMTPFQYLRHESRINRIFSRI